MKIMTSGPITSWQMEGGKVEAVTNFTFLGSKVTVDSNCNHEIKKHFLLGRKVKVLVSCPALCKPMNFSPPGYYIHGIFQQEYWSGLPSPPPGGLPDPGIECISLKTHQVNTIKKW